MLRELGLAWTMGRGIRGRTEEKARLTQKWSGEQLDLASRRNLEENIVHQGTGSGVISDVVQKPGVIIQYQCDLR